jgi:hypothetical protein
VLKISCHINIERQEHAENKYIQKHTHTHVRFMAMFQGVPWSAKFPGRPKYKNLYTKNSSLKLVNTIIKWLPWLDAWIRQVDWGQRARTLAAS